MVANKCTKYIFVTGGVVSSIGKGLAAASIAALLEARGLSVAMQKLDPYLNVDPGTMSPLQHGEVFVTDDGAETDLDLGHYERFSHAALTRGSSASAGQVYQAVIDNERRGDYLGGTVQVIPHVTDEIKRRILANAAGVDAAIVEVGGTVGDIESLPFLEAIRQFRGDCGADNVMYVHVTLVPYIKAAHELKTKPTQHSVKELQNAGIQPDLLLCRCERPLSAEARGKLANFCNVAENCVLAAADASSIYAVPLALHREGLDARVVERLGMWTREPDLVAWERLQAVVDEPPAGTVRIAVVGKYVALTEAYKSLAEALAHGGFAHGCHVRLLYLDAERFEHEPAAQLLAGADGLLIPGGFGDRGTEGKIAAIQHARTVGLPFFGICLGMQLAVIEYARNVCGLADVYSAEFRPDCANPVINLLPSQLKVSRKGGTMRLGAYPCELVSGSLAARVYGATAISERHRHRYEFNGTYQDQLEKAGLIVSGVYPEAGLVEVVELPDHPWFLACQFHPEFKSKPLAPHPLFAAFVAAARARRDA